MKLKFLLPAILFAMLSVCGQQHELRGPYLLDGDSETKEMVRFGTNHDVYIVKNGELFFSGRYRIASKDSNFVMAYRVDSTLIYGKNERGKFLKFPGGQPYKFRESKYSSSTCELCGQYALVNSKDEINTLQIEERGFAIKADIDGKNPWYPWGNLYLRNDHELEVMLPFRSFKWNRTDNEIQTDGMQLKS